MDLSLDGTGGGKDVHMGPQGCPQAGGPGWEVSGGSLRPSPRGEDSRQSSGQCERSFGAGRSLNGTGPPGGTLTLPPAVSTPSPQLQLPPRVKRGRLGAPQPTVGWERQWVAAFPELQFPYDCDRCCLHDS